MNVLIIGSNGFIGRNLKFHLIANKEIKIFEFNRSDQICKLQKLINLSDFIFHFAAENRPKDIESFQKTNVNFTKIIVKCIKETLRTRTKKLGVYFSSSIQANTKTHYGLSKKKAELILKNLINSDLTEIIIDRLPNIFGKWCKPNYNSVVATYCYNISRNKKIIIENPQSKLELVYIDDLIIRFLSILKNFNSKRNLLPLKKKIFPIYKVSVKELACQIKEIKKSRKLILYDQNSEFDKKLYATYISYLSPNHFKYKLKEMSDPRGKFIEFLKKPSSGQISYFTTNLNSTRGGHYHHTKIEKFLVVNGKAIFRFKNLYNNKIVSFCISEDDNTVVETIPGWVHDITNISDKKLIIMLWTNEVFDKSNPDTILSII